MKLSAFSLIFLPVEEGLHFQVTRLVYLLVLHGQVHLSMWFSIREKAGISRRIVVKYNVDATWLMVMKG